jgi:serine/threonine-protein kinase
MSESRAAEVKRLFLEVCELPAEQRSQRLHESTSDRTLIDKVLALIERDAQTTRIAAPLEAMLAGALGPELASGDTLGTWRLGEELGQGGMGSVFLAERNDGHFKQRAAIKLLHGLPTPEALEFLAQERQIMAGLAHPHIARLLDGGATPRGRPYLVMEYVEGVPIDRYCREWRLAPQAILKLFLEVCDAVAFAHQRLVVHCDLKPSNILVNPEGRPLLLDFGIARLLDSGVLQGGAPEGAGQTYAFTPRYASPEQRAGGKVSTASDVYSLGLLLAELLDIPPGKGAATTRVPAGELRAIAAKASAPDPAHRYASVYALAEDLQRYQARQPLRALPTTPAYIAKKFIQRRWPWLLSAGLFAVTVGGFTLRVVVERNGAEHARGVAEHARDDARTAQADALLQRDLATTAQAQALTGRDRAVTAERKALGAEQSARDEALTTREVSNFMVGLFSGADPDTTGKQDVSAVAIVARGRERIETELKGQPAIQAAMFATLARVYENMGRPRDAVALLTRAIETERALKPARPLQLAAALDRLALLKVNLFEDAKAEPLAREARRLFARHAPEESQDTANNLRTLSLALGGLGRFDEAEELILRAWRIQQNIGAPDSDARNIMQHNLAYHYRRAGKLDLAETHFRRALEGKARRIGEKHPSYLNSLEGLAQVLVRLRRLDEAETLLRRSVALRREIYGANSLKVSAALNELAQPIHDSGRLGEAAQIYAETLTIQAAASGLRSLTYAVTLNNLASAHEDMGDFAQAEKAYRESLAIRMATLPESDLSVARLRDNLGKLLLRMGRFDEAGALLERAFEVHRRTFGDKHGDTFASGVALADYRRQTGDINAAQSLLEKMQETAAAMSAPNRIAFLRQRALLSAQLGTLDSALHDLREAEQLAAQFYNTAHPRAWLIKLERAEILQRNKDSSAAAELAAEVLKHVDTVLVAHSPIRERIGRLRAASRLDL